MFVSMQSLASNEMQVARRPGAEVQVYDIHMKVPSKVKKIIPEEDTDGARVEEPIRTTC